MAERDFEFPAWLTGEDPRPGFREQVWARMEAEVSAATESAGADGVVEVAGPLPEGRQSTSTRRAVLAVSVAAVLVMAVVIAVVGLTQADESPVDVVTEPEPEPTPATSEPIITGPGGWGVRSSAAITGASVVGVGNGEVWASGDGGVHRLDPDSGEVVATVPLAGDLAGVAVAHDAVWVLRPTEGELVRIGPDNLEVEARIDVGVDPNWIWPDDDSLWISDGPGGAVVRVDPATNEVTARIDVGGQPFIVNVHDGVWVSHNRVDGLVHRIDPATNTVARTFTLDGASTGMAAGLGSVWIADTANSTLYEIDTTTEEITPIPLDFRPLGPAVSDDSVWIVGRDTCGDGSRCSVVVQLDPDSFDELERITLDEAVQARSISASGESVWVVDGSGAVVQIRRD